MSCRNVHEFVGAFFTNLLMYQRLSTIGNNFKTKRFNFNKDYSVRQFIAKNDHLCYATFGGQYILQRYTQYELWYTMVTINILYQLLRIQGRWIQKQLLYLNRLYVLKTVLCEAIMRNIATKMSSYFFIVKYKSLLEMQYPKKNKIPPCVLNS